MWTCENCKHLNDDESEVCERCGLSKTESECRIHKRESQEEIEQIESDIWDEDQGPHVSRVLQRRYFPENRKLGR